MNKRRVGRIKVAILEIDGFGQSEATDPGQPFGAAGAETKIPKDLPA